MVAALPRVRAPELAIPGVTWLNTAEPWPLTRLKGKLVLLDFWTSCCVNCIHLLPTLAAVEAAFPQDLVVIGVHAPKFAAERDPARVTAAIQRHGIRHAVAHDPDLILWDAYAARAWPTLVLVDGAGYVIGASSGEPDRAGLIDRLGQVLMEERAGGRSQPAPLPTAPAPPEPARFHFPTHLSPLPGGGFVLADSSNHQIVVLRPDGGEAMRVGDGIAGNADGDLLTARFRRPEGVAGDASAIWVADTGNHRLARIDRQTGAVETIAGTGARGGLLGAPEFGLEVSLASPAAITPFGGAVAFANAGTHQLGLYDPADGTITRLAGSGAEGLRDGIAPDAVLAQPAAVAAVPDQAMLFFLDSESSSLRALVIRDQPEVATLIGTGLFDWGAENGTLAEARLQHPLALAFAPGRLYIADSYNDRIRVLDLQRQTISDLDDGFTCDDPICRPLAEPSGIAVAADGALLVVDTNHHRILRYDLTTRRYRTWAE